MSGRGHGITMSVTSGTPTNPGADGMPARIGRFRVLEPIASGGMGTVYLAFAEGPLGTDRWVAIKRVHPHLATDPKFVAMFMDEARIVSRLSHPNVCGLLDFGAGAEGHWLVMPYLWGESFHRVARVATKESSTIKEAFPFLASRIVEYALEGLHAAHELKDESGKLLDVVHRDISPQNLHVGYDGSVHVLDFGVATARQRLASTATGEVKGKFAYMSPEQLDGKKLDRRADVFSMGVVLWEALTGRRLFSRETMTETIRAVLTEPIPPLRDLWPEAPLELEEVVSKALARDPERRYPTARAMARDLALALTELRRPIGMGEIADAMETLFPGALEKRRATIEGARQNALVDDLEVPPPEGDRSAVTLASRAPAIQAAPALAPKPRGSSWMAVLFVATALLTLGIASGRYFLSSQPVAPDPVASSAPVVAPSLDEPPRAVEPLPTEPVPTEPVAIVPAPIVPAPTEPAPTESAPTEPAPTVPEPRHPRGSDTAPRETASGPGSVSVATPGGWAIVYEGGERLGDAPGTFTIPAGAHTLEIQPFGRGERSRHRVRVAAGGTSRLVVPVTAP